MKARWEHHDLIQQLRADEMIAGQAEGNARLKLLRRSREVLLDEIAAILRAQLPTERA